MVEQNQEVRENLVELLALDGYEIESHASGLEGYLSAVARTPAVILCDIMIPGQDIELFLQHINSDKVLARVPLVLFSADREPEMKADCPGVSCHFRLILQKPFSGEALLQVLEKLLR